MVDVAPKVPRIKCKEQQVLMSQYNWETDKIVDAPMTLGDGGDVEEVVALLCLKIFAVIFLVSFIVINKV